MLFSLELLVNIGSNEPLPTPGRLTLFCDPASQGQAVRPGGTLSRLKESKQACPCDVAGLQCLAKFIIYVYWKYKLRTGRNKELSYGMLVYGCSV